MTYDIERSVGGQDARFFDKPHRFYAVVKLPFMYFYIYSAEWKLNEIQGSTEFAVGDLDLEQIKSIPKILFDYIKHLHLHSQQNQLKMSASNRELIIRDMKKNKKITGSDKSMWRSR